MFLKFLEFNNILRQDILLPIIDKKKLYEFFFHGKKMMYYLLINLEC